MHSLRSKWFAVLLACVFMFAAYGHSPAAELPQTGALAPAEALQLMDTLGDKLTVIDVRTEQEYAQGHVPGALLLPIQTLREHMGQVPADGSVLLCRTGRRAERPTT
ncbi:MAG: rhodanese-like domain-containing protein [Bilophila wadsworthia]